MPRLPIPGGPGAERLLRIIQELMATLKVQRATGVNLSSRAGLGGSKIVDDMGRVTGHLPESREAGNLLNQARQERHILSDDPLLSSPLNERVDAYKGVKEFLGPSGIDNIEDVIGPQFRERGRHPLSGEALGPQREQPLRALKRREDEVGGRVESARNMLIKFLKESQGGP